MQDIYRSPTPPVPPDVEECRLHLLDLIECEKRFDGTGTALASDLRWLTGCTSMRRVGHHREYLAPRGCEWRPVQG